MLGCYNKEYFKYYYPENTQDSANPIINPQFNNIDLKYTKFDITYYRIFEQKISDTIGRLDIREIVDCIFFFTKEGTVSNKNLNKIIYKYFGEDQAKMIKKWIKTAFFTAGKTSKNTDAFLKEAYHQYRRYNIKLFILQTLNELSYNSIDKITDETAINKNTKDFDSIFLVFYFLIYSKSDLNIKSEILFSTLDYDNKGYISMNSQSMIKILRKFIFAHLFMTDALLNNYISEIDIETKENLNEGLATTSHSEESRILKNFNYYTLLYKQLLFYVKEHKGAIKDFIIYIAHNLIFTERKTNQKVYKEDFLEIMLKKDYKLFSLDLMKIYLIKFLQMEKEKTNLFITHLPKMIIHYKKQTFKEKKADKVEGIDYDKVIKMDMYKAYCQIQKVLRDLENYQFVYSINEEDNRYREIFENPPEVKLKKKKMLSTIKSYVQSKVEDSSSPSNAMNKFVKQMTFQIQKKGSFANNRVDTTENNKPKLNKISRSIGYPFLRRSSNNKEIFNLNSIGENVDKNHDDKLVKFKKEDNFEPILDNSSKFLIEEDEDVERAIKNEESLYNFNDYKVDIEDFDKVESESVNINGESIQKEDYSELESIVDKSIQQTDNSFSLFLSQNKDLDNYIKEEIKVSFINSDSNNIDNEGFDNMTDRSISLHSFWTKYFKAFQKMALYDPESIKTRLYSADEDKINRLAKKYQNGVYLYNCKKDDLYDICNNKITPNLINFYLWIIQNYNIFLIKQRLITTVVKFLDTDFFKMVQDSYISDKNFNSVLNNYKSTLFNDKGEFFIYSKDEIGSIYNKHTEYILEYILIVPIYLENSMIGMKSLFLAKFEFASKKIIMYDASDILFKDFSIKSNYKILFETFFAYLIKNKVLSEDYSNWDIEVNLNCTCYSGEDFPIFVLLKAAESFCKDEEPEFHDEVDYEQLRDAIFLQLSEFYLSLQ